MPTDIKAYMKQYYLDNKEKYHSQENRDRLKEYKKQWRKNNPEKVKQYSVNSKERIHQWYLNNREKILDYHKKYQINNKGGIKAYYEKNKDKILKQHREWLIKNIEKVRLYEKQYHTKNKIRIRKRKNQWGIYMRKTDLKFNLNGRISNGIYKSLKRNKDGYHWETLVGYKVNDLIKHLQKTIPEGYTWQDFIEGKLHIDHIIPKSVFNFSQYEHIDFQRCWELKNLQLLPAKKNLKKHTKLYKPFQPALKI